MGVIVRYPQTFGHIVHYNGGAMSLLFYLNSQEPLVDLVPTDFFLLVSLYLLNKTLALDNYLPNNNLKLILLSVFTLIKQSYCRKRAIYIRKCRYRPQSLQWGLALGSYAEIWC